jgi:hypothetical protein
MTGRGLRGREQAQLLLGAVLVLDGVLAFLLIVAPPNMMGPMFETPPSAFGLPLGSVIAAIGIALHLGGLAWMVRILRADPEAHSSWWRFDRS